MFNSFFLCVYFFFLCGLTHGKISFNLGEHNFSVRVRPTEKLFLTVNPQKKSIFLSFYFCGLFSDGTPSEKYFSDGIRIFPWVFAHTEKREIPVVYVAPSLLPHSTNQNTWLWMLHASQSCSLQMIKFIPCLVFFVIISRRFYDA